jgi:hypothetical protein
MCVIKIILASKLHTTFNVEISTNCNRKYRFKTIPDNFHYKRVNNLQLNQSNRFEQTCIQYQQPRCGFEKNLLHNHILQIKKALRETLQGASAHW